MTSEAPRAPSHVIVMGAADQSVLDALRDHRGSIQSEVLDVRDLDEAVRSILRARPDLALVPEDPHGQSHLELCARVKRLNPRIATVVLREVLTEIPPAHPAVDDYVALGSTDEMMARVNVLLRLRAFNARARALRQRLADAFRAFDLSADLLADGRLLPPSKVDGRALLDLDELRDHEAALSKVGNTSFACFLHAPEPQCLFTTAREGCLRAVCPVAQVASREPGFAVACDECRVAAWHCARDAMLTGHPKSGLCPGGYRLAAFPVCLRFRSVQYPLLAVAVALPSPIDLEQLDRLAERLGEDSARLRHEVARRPLPTLSRVHLDALLRIEENMAESLSRRVSNEYATAYNILAEAVTRSEHDRALTRRSGQLQRANERLRETSRLRNEFLANLSHELRTPMTSIIGYSTLLLRGSGGELSEKAQQLLDRVLANARTLHAAIDDVLDLAQLGSPDLAVHPTPFAPAPLLRECLDAIRPRVADKPIALHADLPADLPEIETDRERLRQVLLHLLSNAAKFTHHGEVRLAARVEPDPELPRLAIAVSDTGVGLPAEALPHIFEEFRQVDGSATRQHGGVGIGLSLVKKLCRVLGGEVTVQTREAAGSTFTVTLPLSLSRLQARRQELKQRVLAGEPDPDDRSTPIVLVVTEGNPQLVLTLREWAAPHGCRVASVFRFDEALERARGLLPFAVLVDVTIPGHEVWELADELRADPRTTDTPLLVASPIDDAAVAEAAGANDRLRKPIERDAFLNALDRLRPEPSRGGDAGTILVILRDPAERDRLRQALRESAFRPAACATCSDAAHFAQTPFDAVVFDPEAEGEGDLTALGTLRAGPWARTPLVACVAPTCPAAIREPLETDTAAVIVQGPDGSSQVVEALTRLLADGRAHRPTA